LPALIPAFATCVIATVVAWVGLGNESQYSLPPLAISSPLVVWSIVMGPVFGFAAYGFVRGAGAARAHAPRDRRLPLWCAVVFPVIGLLAIPFPQLLGNGKGVAQEVFDCNIGLTVAVVLLLLRVLVTLGALRAGAEGGLLTPGLSIGALLGIILGGFWNYAWPGLPLGAFAIVGSAAFLASSMKMPLTAVVLIMEFTRIGHDFLVPMLFGVIGSVSVFYLCTKHVLPPAWRAHHDDIPRSVSRELTAALQVGP
jgi:H+/Cl- antiporter ClcA